MKKILVYSSILLLVGTSLSPTILGLVKEIPRIINDNESETEIFGSDELDYHLKMEKLCKFYNLNYEKQIFEDFNSPISYEGYWDYTIKGYITDETTSDPIEDATILIISIGKHMSFDRDTTTTDATGYYEISLEDIFYGEVIYFVRATGYYSKYMQPWPLIQDEVIWINASLTPGAPPVNSVVNGYIYNADDADPIEGAVVDINWVDDNGHGDWIYTVTDSNGFYSVNVQEGEVMPWVYADGYYENYKQPRDVGDGETLEFNVHLYPRFPDNAMIRGYITEELSGDPIESVLIDLNSYNFDENHFDWNYTFTDASGYYEINVAESDFQLDALTHYHARQWGHNDLINSGETYWWNSTLYEIPPQTATICGHITDMNTNDPIMGAYVDIDWEDGLGHDYRKYTMSDDLGFYKINIAPGEIDLQADAPEYFDFEFNNYVIGEWVVKWLNISLEPYPPKNAIVEGYIKSNSTTIPPIKDAFVVAYTENESGDHIGSNRTETDASGFYQMRVAAGEVSLNMQAIGHRYKHTDEYTIQEGQTLRLDFVLEPVRLNIIIEKPLRAIYWNNQLLFPFIFPIILGDIDIIVNGSENLYEVEFYVDNEFKRADRIPDYTCLWDDGTFGFHQIKLICNGMSDKVVTKTINVLKII